MLREPFPDRWLEFLQANVVHYGRLSERERDKLRCATRIFIAEKHWEGCGGMVVDDEVKVTVAAQACLLVLGFDEDYFDHVQSVLIYPDAYLAPQTTFGRGGLVLEGNESREGESWYRGPVILSWNDVLAGGRGESEGNNLVLHEFAHQLDMLSGEMNGTPPLPSRDMVQRWQHIMTVELERLVRDCRHHRPTLLDCYGTKNTAEFFAVATECFFEQPREMRQLHEPLYDLLSQYFRQDPANRPAL